jgi:serine/threonine-protein kinase
MSTDLRAGSAADRVGEVLLRRYQLDLLLGIGKLGPIYRAQQIGFDRSVALRLIDPRFRETDPGFAQRFTRHATTLADVSHTNVVPVLDYGETEKHEQFITSEYLDGRTIAQVLNSGEAVPFPEIFQLGLQIARGLRKLHQKNIFHRDLVPSSLFYTTPTPGSPVRISDVGLTALVGAAQHRSELFGLEGGGAYVAPEQLKGAEGDARSDIYSLGAILYHLSAGVAPLRASSLPELKARLEVPIPSIAAVGFTRACPDQLELIIFRCMEPAPEDRYETTDALVHALKSAFGAAYSTALEPPPEGTTGSRVASVSISGSNSLTGSRPNAFGGPEADVSGSSSVIQPSPATSRPSMARWTLAAAVGVAGAAGAAFFVLDHRSSAPPPAAQQPESDESVVTFESEPRGAAVYEKDLVVGVTPFVHVYPRSGPEAFRRFRFQLDGHEPLVVQQALSEPRVRLKVSLKPNSKK